jgi:AGZA family xanthine/uracil permease-like MFS transporter
MSSSLPPTPAITPRWFVRADVDGFFGLALDNLVQILVIVSLTQFVLGFPADLIYGRILPSIALSLIVGNLYYSWLAYRQGQREGRDDITALPYGINTVSLFAYIFLVMLPVRLAALNGGASEATAAELAWQAGLVACLGSGLIELGGAWGADWLRRYTPRAALLSTLAGIALTFIALGFFLRTYAHPLVGIVPLGIILLTYFGKVTFRLPGMGWTIPGGLLAVILGIILAWGTGLAQWSEAQWQTAIAPVNLYLPHLDPLSLWQAKGVLLQYFSVILPMGLFNLVGSLQNLESAAAAGDHYPTAPCLAVNGLGTIIAALSGSCFPTTIYIGHPGWKEMGARVGYSWLNALVMAILCLSGSIGVLVYLVPIDSSMAIVLWIGIVIVAQSFSATPERHYPAVVMGLLPGIAGWGALVAKNALRVAGMGTPDQPFSPELLPKFAATDLFIGGAFALEQGLIFSAMILAAMTVYIIEQKFGLAALWAIAAAVLSWIGLLHSYEWTMGDTVLKLGWGAGGSWAVGYLLLAGLLLYVQWTQPPSQLSNKDPD